MNYLKANFPRFLKTAKEVFIVLLQCTAILTLILLGAAVFNMQGGYLPFFWM